MPRVVFLTPASPNAGFYSEIAAIDHAIKALPWGRWEPELYVFMGSRPPFAESDDSFERWRVFLREVNFSYVSEASWERINNWAQVEDSLLMAPRGADVYVTLDADTLPVAGLESVLDEVYATQSVAGVMAHFPPGVLPNANAWRDLATRIGLSNLDFSCEYSLVSHEAPEERRKAPIYFNGGVVFFSQPCFDRFIRTSIDIRWELVDRSDDFDFFSSQIAMTLAITKLGLPYRVLPMRYNYPNDDIALRTQPGELENVAIFHYLRTQHFDRRKIFTNAVEYQKFLGTSLTGSNLAFQTEVRRVLGSVYPFA